MEIPSDEVTSIMTQEADRNSPVEDWPAWHSMSRIGPLPSGVSLVTMG